MALLKYFAPSKMFNVCVRICKHIARLWVWLHLTGLSSKIKTWKRSMWPIREGFHPRKFSRYTVVHVWLSSKWSTPPTPFLLLSHSFCSHWTNLPRTMLEVASQIVWHIHAIAAWRVMQTLSKVVQRQYHFFVRLACYLVTNPSSNYLVPHPWYDESDLFHDNPMHSCSWTFLGRIHIILLYKAILLSVNLNSRPFW